MARKLGELAGRLGPRGRLVLWGAVVAASGAAVLAGAAMPSPAQLPTPAPAEDSPGSDASPGGDVPRGDEAPRDAGVAAADADTDGGAPADFCAIADRGLGSYRPWKRLTTGAVLVPDRPPRPDGYDLLIHFHGSEAVRKVLAPADLPIVIAALDAGRGSQPYEQALSSPQALDAMLQAVAEAVAAAWGSSPPLRHLIVSSWSAGYGAVRQILVHHPDRPAAVVLLDSLHASYRAGGGLETLGLEPFVALAERASRGAQQLVVTHSEIRPPDFASTAETAGYLVEQLGAQRRYAGLRPAAGLEQKTELRDDGLIVRGFTGADRDAHCAHLSLLLPILRDDVLASLPP